MHVISIQLVRGCVLSLQNIYTQDTRHTDTKNDHISERVNNTEEKERGKEKEKRNKPKKRSKIIKTYTNEHTFNVGIIK